MGTNESDAALPKWTRVETRHTLCFNAALSSCEKSTISSSAHLAFIKIDITFQAHCSHCGLFSVITIHLGLIKDEFCWITWKYLHNNTMRFETYVHQAQLVVFLQRSRCKISLLPFLSWVSNDIGLIHRCNQDTIWITTQVVIHIYASWKIVYCPNYQKKKKNLCKGKIGQCRTFPTGNSHCLWHDWITHKTLRTMPYVILVLLNLNQMSLAVLIALWLSTEDTSVKQKAFCTQIVSLLPTKN